MYVSCLFSKVHTYFPVACPPGFLQAEIVVQFLVGQVAAFEREIVSALLYAITHRQVVRELVGYDEVALFPDSL